MNLNDYSTPETDKAECVSSRYEGEEIPGFNYVEADHARNLERRLALCRDVMKLIMSLSVNPDDRKAIKEALTATAPK